MYLKVYLLDFNAHSIKLNFDLKLVCWPNLDCERKNINNGQDNKPDRLNAN